MRGSSSFCLTFSRRASNSALDPWMKQHGTANDTSYQKISSPPSKTTGFATRGSIPINSFYIISDKVPVGGGIAGVVEELEGAPKVVFVGGGIDVSCLHSPVFRIACLWGWLIRWALFLFNPRPTLTILLLQALLSVVQAGTARSIIILVLFLLSFKGSKTGRLARKGDVGSRSMHILYRSRL